MTEKMNPERKAQWVAALRSGEYKQGKDALEADGKFCCLGVLCDLAVKAGEAKRSEREHEIIYSVDDEGADWQSEELPAGVARWAGLGANVNPEVPDPTSDEDEVYYGDLADLNDRGTSFTVIADLIEEYL